MSYKDFISNFTELEICNLSLEPMEEEESVVKFNQSMAQGKWSKKGQTAGGCRNFPTFQSNPQFMLELKDGDDDDDDGKCSVLLALMQKDRRSQRHLGVADLCIGFSVYKVPDSFAGKLDKKFFDYNASVANSGSFTNLREVQNRFALVPGKYVVIPCSFNPDEEGDFLLRIFTEKATESKNVKNEDETPKENKDNDPHYELFLRLAGKDKEVDPEELQEILSIALKAELKGNKFRLETCRAMVSALDLDYSGKLDYDEFTEVMTLVRQWKETFKKYDRSRMGRIHKREVERALKAIGYTDIDDRLVDILMKRYSSRGGTIDFDDFCNCTLRLRAMSYQFQKHSKGGIVSLGKSDFLAATMLS